MSRFALDTSAWIEYFSKGSDEVNELISNEEIYTSVISIAEIADIFLRNHRESKEVLRFIKEKSEIVNVDFDISIMAAKIKNTVIEKNKKFGLADAIHLACSKKVDAVFITKDNDFRGLDRVRMLK